MSESTHEKTSRTGFLRFIASIVKITLAITLSILILAGIGAGVGISYYRHQQNKQKPYAEPKFWTVETVEVIENTEFHLKTKWEDGYLYYQFNILGYPSLIKKHYDDGDTSRYSISINFYDSNGFLLHDLEIYLNQFSRNVGKDGYSGLSSNSKIYMSFDNYKKIVSWSIGWRL